MADSDPLDAVLKTIQASWICVPCIARRTGLAVLRVDVVLRTLVTSFAAALKAETCEACGQVTQVYRMGSAR